MKSSTKLVMPGAILTLNSASFSFFIIMSEFTFNSKNFFRKIIEKIY